MIMYDINIKTEDYRILGEMVVGCMSVSAYDPLFLRDTIDIEDEIKNRLANHIAKYLIDNKLIEFTRSMAIADNAMTFKARVFVTPDDQVRILRTTKT